MLSRAGHGAEGKGVWGETTPFLSTYPRGAIHRAEHFGSPPGQVQSFQNIHGCSVSTREKNNGSNELFSEVVMVGE